MILLPEKMYRAFVLSIGIISISRNSDPYDKHLVDTNLPVVVAIVDLGNEMVQSFFGGSAGVSRHDTTRLVGG